MDDLTLRLSIAALEEIFIFVLFAALAHQKKRIGETAFYMSFCAVLFFGCVAAAAHLKLPWPGGYEVDFRQIVIQIPLMGIFLMVYITSGVLKSQQLLIGAVCSYLVFIYFSIVVRLQCSFLPEEPVRAVIFSMLDEVREAVNVNAVCNLLAFFTLPMFYSLSVRLKSRFWRIVIALFAAQTVALIPVAVLKSLNEEMPAYFHHVNLSAVVSLLLVAFLLAGYLRLLGRELPEQRAGVFDFIFAFFGSYSRVRELEEDVSRWENRYHLVLHQTAEAVLMCDIDGRITEANIAAAKIFAVKRADNLIGKELFSLFTPETPLSPEQAASEPVYFNCAVICGDEKRILSASVSPVKLKNQRLLVMVARDITAERELAAEKEQLTNQLMHAQRMESLGVLAGGIAHDFNNYIHAILGHADVAMLMSGGDPEKTESHLRKITVIAEKAGKLTSQLLGFARKGKYHVVDIDIKELLEECSGLLEPLRLREVTVRYRSREGVLMRGDQLQMQQVVMNLLINALDAMENVPEKILTLSSGQAVDAPLEFMPPPDCPGAAAADYIYFSVSDNGAGMDEETRRKIFEPFFTTKPVGHGTGMGLAMVYGTVSHHKGWIALASSPGVGTTFCVFLPAAGTD